MPHFLTRPNLTPDGSLKTLVENRTTYSFNKFEFNVFETHQKAEQVNLTFSDFVLTSMFRGKKVMRLNGYNQFDYLPGESVIVAPGETMCIDFPDANKINPTQCLAVEISKDLISSTIDLLNERYEKPDACGDWTVNAEIYHLLNDETLAQTIDRAVNLTINDSSKSKELILELTMKEMLVRIMQTQARKLIEKNFSGMSSSNPMACVIEYMSRHLSESFTTDELAAKAYMSRAKFFQKFKEMFGISPAKFVLNLRLENAKKVLRRPNSTITEAAYSSGFENISHFITAFKREVGTTPGNYKLEI